MRATTFLAAFSLTILSLGGCTTEEPTPTDAGPDGGPGPLDAGPLDARPLDAGIDAAPLDAGTDAAGPDAPPPPSFAGRIGVHEVSVLGVPQLGQGLRIEARFDEVGTVGTLLYEETPGSPTGCRVFEYTAAEVADVGLDEGTMFVTAADDDPGLRGCVYFASRGYQCVAGSGNGGTVAPVDLSMGLWSLTDTELTPAPSHVGRYVVIYGASSAGNVGAFPIVGSASATTIVFVNASPAALPETLPATASFELRAAAGPIPGTADPGFVEDDDVLTVSLDPTGSAAHFEAFTRTFAAPGVGDDFTLDTASQTTMLDLPSDGAAFTIGCGGAGGTCGTATASVLVVTTTDAPLAGLPPYAFPPPVSRRVVIECSAIGASEVTVPAAASAFLVASGATRLETMFARDALAVAANASAPEASTSIAAGHAILGYTTR